MLHFKGRTVLLKAVWFKTINILNYPNTCEILAASPEEIGFIFSHKKQEEKFRSLGN